MTAEVQPLRRHQPDGVGCELSVVMPCLNEADTIGACIEKAWRALRTHQVDGEIVVADNGSTDRSRDIAEGLGARVSASLC